MKSLQRIAVFVGFVALICSAAIAWHFVEARATVRRLAEDARTSRERAEHGDANAQYDLARLYYQGKGVPQDYSEAFGWYRKAADQGNAKAQYGVGFMYYWGKGVPQDYAQAFTWYRKAAESGNEKAEYDLGFMYHEGKGVPQDRNAAFDWRRKAADQGYARAQYALGSTYFEAKEVPQDYTEAVRWYRKAADQGYAEAESYLGYMYSHGKGVPRDDGEAARWYRKAASQGDDYARRALSSMKIGFTPLSKIDLSLAFLGSISLLIHSGGRVGTRKQRRTVLAGLLCLLWVGLTVYGRSHFGILLSLSAVNAFYLGKSLVSGIGVAMLLSIAWPQVFKYVWTMSSLLFIGFNVYATMHYDLRYFNSCPRAFFSINGFLISMSLTVAILRWAELEKPGEGPRDEIALGL